MQKTRMLWKAMEGTLLVPADGHDEDARTSIPDGYLFIFKFLHSLLSFTFIVSQQILVTFV